MGACVSVPASSGFLKRGKRNKIIIGDDVEGIVPNLNSKHALNQRSKQFSLPKLILKDQLSSPSEENDCENNVFEKYEFGNELGRGEFGITYKCTDKETGENVACKTISKCKLRTEIDVEDVRREVEIMRRLPKHPNIVSYKAVYEDKDAIYLVMELCEGGELFDRIVSRGHFTERDAANVTKTIMEVVKVNYIYIYIYKHID